MIKVSLTGYRETIRNYDKAIRFSILRDLKRVVDRNLELAVFDAKSRVKTKLSKYRRTKKTGKLARSIEFKSKFHGRSVVAQLIAGRRPKADYAGLHEEGGTVTPKVTPKSRGYFFFKYYESGKSDKRWLMMAITKKPVMVIDIPARPYLKPALKRILPRIIRQAKIKLDSLNL